MNGSFHRITRQLAISLLAATSFGCEQADSVREYFRDPTPHEAYVLNLAHAGLSETALGQDWIRVSTDAVKRPLVMDAPYVEEGFFPPREPSALGYRFPLKRGQRLTVRIELESSETARLFVDLFRSAPDTMRAPVPVQSDEVVPGGANTTEMVFEPRRNGDYLLRIQPELLRGGRFTVVVEKEPAFEFPVAGRTHRSIGSFFGDPREAGRRRHHGVDIFAPRGTPVVASAEAYVSRVDTTPVGGRVIWLRDRQRNASIYYAHLNEILIREDAPVFPGDTIGRVGNTGNARTTPPHLHFGLYIRGEGPSDPWDYLFELPSELEPVQVELAELGDWVRITGREIYLRERPSRRGQVVAELP
ncbi:MAG: M23 family metallopeptidase, partial [Gemmatimonadetes bacterium]|nr:M23 family metallopeptidase [Gemmatimonadota bacterium]